MNNITMNNIATSVPRVWMPGENRTFPGGTRRYRRRDRRRRRSDSRFAVFHPEEVIIVGFQQFASPRNVDIPTLPIPDHTKDRQSGHDIGKTWISNGSKIWIKQQSDDNEIQ